MTDTVITLAQKLVKINSITTSGTSEWAAQGGEENLAKWLVTYLSSYDFQCELLPIEPGRPNLICRHKQFDSSLPTVAFEAHLDTVDVDGMTIDPFAADIHDNKLWGRGACDVKGTMAAMICSLLNWYQSQKTHNFNLIFIATAAEETGTFGSKFLADKNLDLDMIIVGEPTLLNPVIGHNGVWRFSIETMGRACHSSRPYKGLNAIDGMISVLQVMRDIIKPDFESFDGNFMSITTLHGGQSVNIIPDNCKLEIDARFSEKMDIASFKSKMLEELENLGNIDEIQKPIFTEIQNYPAFCTMKNSQLLVLIESALRNLDLKYKHLVEPWYSDAGFFSKAGYDTIIWGAGDIRNAHTADEHIELDQLVAAEKALNQFLLACKDHYEHK